MFGSVDYLGEVAVPLLVGLGPGLLAYIMAVYGKKKPESPIKKPESPIIVPTREQTEKYGKAKVSGVAGGVILLPAIMWLEMSGIAVASFCVGFIIGGVVLYMLLRTD